MGLNRSSLFFTFIEGTKTGVTSQIAAKMCLDAVVEAVLGSFEPQELFSRKAKPRRFKGGELVKAGFREANRVVYDYGAKMLSGAKISATGVSAAFDGTHFAIGRTGDYDCFLWRDERLLRFYEIRQDHSAQHLLERLLGSNKKVRVDLASVGVNEGDIIVLCTFQANAAWEANIAEFLLDGSSAADTAEFAAKEGARTQEIVADALEKNLFAAVFEVHEPLILLEDVVLG
jgi:hypothetical protein